MIIYIEALIPLVLILILFIWAIWFRISRKIAERRYKPENDKGRLAEETRLEQLRQFAAGEPQSSFPALSVPGVTSPAEQPILPPAASEPVGKDSNGSGKNSKSNGGFFKLFRKRRKS